MTTGRTAGHDKDSHQLKGGITHPQAKTLSSFCLSIFISSLRVSHNMIWLY